jgi:hypothetical protein
MWRILGLAILSITAALAQSKLDELRNLGKAFYENPTTQREAVDTLKAALDLAPDSPRERLNYGLALLRAARQAEGIEQLLRVQKLSPAIPHTWFTLGIEYKKQGDPAKALEQMEGAAKLDPFEPIIQYNLGAILKQLDRPADALAAFERARDLDGNLAAARFQLFNAYRQAENQTAAQRELAEFQRIKQLTAGAAVPEDVDWCQYSEIYDPKLSPGPLPVRSYRTQRIPGNWSGAIAYGDQPLFWDARGAFLAGRRILSTPGIRGIGTGDLDNNGTVDLCTAGDILRAWRNVAGVWKPVALPAIQGQFQKCLWLDYDHDYDLDLFAFGDRHVLLRNQGKAGFENHSSEFPFRQEPATDAAEMREIPDTRGFDLIVQHNSGPVLYKDLLLGKYAVRPPISWEWNQPLAIDWNRDGRTDYLANTSDGWQVRIDNTPQPERTLVVNLTGVRNLRSAHSAVVEVRAGAFYESRRYQGFPLRFHLGNAKTVDVVRITWPNGLVQNEMRKPTNIPLIVREAQRLSGSCPIIWTWNGREFQYNTDVLGVAPLGASSGDGTFFTPDHDEYITLPSAALRPNKGGLLEVRLTEELSEAAYFDRVRLLAIDHPRGAIIHTSEKWKNPPFLTFQAYQINDHIPATRAADHRGNNVTALVRHQDQRYPNHFRRTAAGVAEVHTLTLEFPNAPPSTPALLILSGWVDWADGSTFLAAAQERNPLQTPILEVRDAHGNWTLVDADMGMPSGKPKTIVVDLTGKFPTRRRELRIRTNLCVYWDQIYLSQSFSNAAAPQELPLVNATLRFRGFSPSTIHPERLQPERFHYSNPTPTSLWNPTPGHYTAYGEVTARLRHVGDALAIMGSGDELQLTFLPPPTPPHLERTYLLHVDGWAKDRDANTEYSQTVAPFPSRGMTRYAESQAEVSSGEHTRPALRLLRPLK